MYFLGLFYKIIIQVCKIIKNKALNIKLFLKHILKYSKYVINILGSQIDNKQSPSNFHPLLKFNFILYFLLLP